MRFEMTVASDNDAFRDPGELPGLIRVVADKIQHSGRTEGAVVDSNGNTVGQFMVTP